MEHTAQLIAEALRLKPAERFMVIDALMQSLDAPNPDLDAVWLEEAEKRLAAYKAGRLATVSLEDMFGECAT